MVNQPVTLVKSVPTALPWQQAEPPLDRLINGLSLLILLVIVGLCLIALVLVLSALFPKACQRSKAAAHSSPRRAFLIGLANYLFLGGISLVLFSLGNEVISIIGLVIVTFLATVSAIGLTGVVALLGERLAGMQGQEMSRLRQSVLGTLALLFAGLLPFFGWFVFIPVVLMVSFGAAVLAWRNRKQTVQELNS